MDRNKELANNLTDFIVANKSNANFSKLYETKYLSIQIANSQNDTKMKSEFEALFKHLSLIDYSSCEQYLKDINKINDNETLTFSKIDWDDNTKTDYLNNENKTLFDAVSYSLYTESGQKLDMNLCNDTTTIIQIHLSGIYNLSSELNNTDFNGLNPYDISDSYYNDKCLPISNKNNTKSTLEDKRKYFDNLNISCSSGCIYQKINISSGYLTCKCKGSLANKQISPEYGKVLLSVINSVNILIFECFQTFVLYVSLLL